jgi:hypothetical protein
VAWVDPSADMLATADPFGVAPIAFGKRRQ